MDQRFRQRHTFQERCLLAEKIQQSFGDERVAVLAERHPLDRTLRAWPRDLRSKFLVPKDVTFGWMHAHLRSHLTPRGATPLPADAALFLFLEMPDGSYAAPSNADTMARLAHSGARHPDGFLYMLYSGESTFGAQREDGDSPPLPTTPDERVAYYYRDYRPLDPPFLMPLAAIVGGRELGVLTYLNKRRTPPVRHRAYICEDGTELYDPFTSTSYPLGTIEWLKDIDAGSPAAFCSPPAHLPMVP